MSKLLENIYRLAAMIKGETRSGANSAARVGGLFEEIAAELEQQDKEKLDKTGNGENVSVTFNEASTRTNVASGDKLSVLFGKIKRWFSDLKTVAFTGKASDLSQDTNNRLVTDTEKAGWYDKYTRVEVDSKDAAGLQAAKEYAVQKIAEIVNGSPEALDTLQELAAALGNDPNFATSIMALIGGKADTVHSHTKAQITDFPAALPAKGGNADTVDNHPIIQLGRIFPEILNNIDDASGFVASGWGDATVGDKPGTYGTILQVSNSMKPISSGDGQIWAFQIAHIHGNRHPVWRTQVNRGGWSAWERLALVGDIPASLPASDVYAWAKQAVKPTYNINEIYDADSVWVPVGMVNRKTIIKNTKIGNGYTSSAAIGLTNPENKFGSVIVSAALNDEATSWADWTFDPATGRITNPSGKTFVYTDEILQNAGDQTLSNGRFYLNISAPEHVIMFKDAAGNIGSIGFGAYPTRDLQIMNYASGKYINMAANGRLYYNNKEIATVDQLAIDKGGIGNRDWNTILTPGSYVTSAADWGTNGPSGVYLYGILVVAKAGTAVTQTYCESSGGAMFYRIRYSDAGGFGVWITVAKKSEIPKTTANLPDSADKRYVTDTEKAKIANTLEVICAGVVNAGGTILRQVGDFRASVIGFNRVAIDHDWGQSDNYMIMTMDSAGKTATIDIISNVTFAINFISSAMNTRFVMYKI